jgi:hypothetical protein
MLGATAFRPTTLVPSLSACDPSWYGSGIDPQGRLPVGARQWRICSTFMSAAPSCIGSTQGS